MKEENFPNSRKSPHEQVCGEFWNLRGQHNWEEKMDKLNPQITGPTTTPKGKVAQTRIGHQQEPGAGQGGMGCMLRVRTGPECPEDNLRELM